PGGSSSSRSSGDRTRTSEDRRRQDFFHHLNTRAILSRGQQSRDPYGFVIGKRNHSLTNAVQR
ncbi:unnamed protein product, partial [Amoebophrya sp. A25]